MYEALTPRRDRQGRGFRADPPKLEVVLRPAVLLGQDALREALGAVLLRGPVLPAVLHLRHFVGEVQVLLDPGERVHHPLGQGPGPDDLHLRAPVHQPEDAEFPDLGDHPAAVLDHLGAVVLRGREDT